MDEAVRFLRHFLVAEIGRAGQARIAASVARVGRDPRAGGEIQGRKSQDALAHEMAERYAERAGFATIAPGSIDIEKLAPLDVVRTAAARAVLAGSRASLAAIRSACGVRADDDGATTR
jgi:hypothetical protein